MFMQAVVIDVQWGRLLVLDLATRQNVIVNTPEARLFRPGDFVLIWFNGVMTKSIPPQITAISITRVRNGVFPPISHPPMVRPPIIFPPIVPPIFPPTHPPHGRPRPRPPRRRG